MPWLDHWVCESVKSWISVWNSFVNLWFCDSDLTKKNMINFRESQISVYSLHKATVQLHKTWNIGYTFMIFFVIFFVHVHYWKNGQDILQKLTCVTLRLTKKKKKRRFETPNLNIWMRTVRLILWSETHAPIAQVVLYLNYYSTFTHLALIFFFRVSSLFWKL